MFGKFKVSKSLLDAVNSVIGTDSTQVQQLDEATSEKVPTPTGTKVYGHRYGDSKKARKDQTKSAVDDLKGPKDKEMKEELKGNQHKIDKNYNNKIDAQDFKILRGKKEVKESDDCVTKPEAKKIADQEVDNHEKGMHKGKKITVKEGSFSERLVAMYEAKSSGTEPTFTDNNIGEKIDTKVRTLDTLKGRVKAPSSYDDAIEHKSSKVKLSAEEKAEAKGYKVLRVDSEQVVAEMDKSQRPPSRHGDYALGAKGTTVKPTTPKKVVKDLTKVLDKAFDTKLVKKTALKENEIKQISEAITVKKEYDDKREAEHGVYHNGKKIGYIVHDKKHDTHTAYHSPSSHDEQGHADDFGQIDDFHSHHHAVSQIRDSAGVSPKEVHEGVESPSKNQDVADKAYLKHKPGTVKGQLTQIGRFLRGKPEIKEEVELDEEQLDEMINEALGKDANAGDWIHDFVHSDNPKFAGKSKAERKKMALGAYYGKKNEEVEAVEEKVIAGTPGWKEVPKEVKDKSGAVHSPMSRAKDLAKKAFKKVKNETMMGKISN